MMEKMVVTTWGMEEGTMAVVTMMNSQSILV